jgi:4-amino-4-deoxy-L-arabinose transferase-like glycosyltransferase
MKLRPAILPGLVLLASLLLMLGSARRASMTVDEAHYIGVGRYLAEKGDWGLKGALLHPPLPYYLNSVLLAGVPVSDSAWAAPHQDDRGRALVRSLPGDRVLLLTRLPTILLTLALFLILYIEANRAFGGVAALFALLLAAFEPNLLAHGALATPDLPVTALAFLAAARFRRLREKPDAGNVLLAGTALGLALLSKYSALLLVLALPIAALADGAGRRFFFRVPLVLLAAFVVVHAAYAPRLLHGGGSPFGSMLLPPPYEDGVRYQARANQGHHAFFMGQISDRGWRAYYPVAFLVKTPLPFLLLAAAGAGLLVRRRRRGDLAWLLVPPLLFFLFFVFASRINIGVRYVLPAHPFLAALGGLAAASAWEGGRRFRAAVAALALWYALGTGIAYPHFLSYFNEAAGGPEGGARLLADSNIDWGQDLPGLRDFLGGRSAYLAYFGNDDPARYGISYRFLPGWIYSPPPRVYDESLRVRPKPELVAVSRMLMQGVWLPEPDLYRWLEEFPRVGTIGHSILVYDITGDPAAHERLAGAYKKAGHLKLFQDELVLQYQAEKRRK